MTTTDHRAGAKTGVDELCELIYPGRGESVARDLRGLMARHPVSENRERWVADAGDSVLITYGDQISSPGEHPLATLADFIRRRLPFIPIVHLLPFFPYSSDDGFSVIDYTEVDPKLGEWRDITAMGAEKGLMFDAVINHISAESPWIADYLAGRDPHRDLAIAVDPDADLHEVVRPRTSPLLTSFEAHDGPRHLWTTFSADQVDLNYGSPATLLSVIEVLLDYVRHGASLLRLDAIAFAWKEIGTPSIHHENTHRIVKLIRAVLDEVASHVAVITETNVPHAENVSYFGNGHDEAQLVYNFALPPLVLHTFTAQNTEVLAKWASALETPTDSTWFFNYLASHDGIGVRGAEAILSAAELAALSQQVLDHGGFVGFRTMPDGTRRPYELNINFFDALSDPSSDEPMQTQVDRFLCAHSIALALPGVPGIYAHSLFGSRSDRTTAEKTGIYRSINRQKLDRKELESHLQERGSLRHTVFEGLRALLEIRGSLPEMDPSAPHAIEDFGTGVFAIRRGRLLCLHNVTAQQQSVSVTGADLLGGTAVRGTLEPYRYAWVSVPDA